MNYIGIDIGGDKNTWLTALEQKDDRIILCDRFPVQVRTLAQIKEVGVDKKPCVVAIDAPLTWSEKDELGWRISDLKLKSMLGSYGSWVLSQNSLMAAPLRGQHLVELLFEEGIRNIIETHPRACLYFSIKRDNEKEVFQAIENYKNKKSGKYVSILTRKWVEKFNLVNVKDADLTEGGLDSLICATIAYLFHEHPQRLRQLPEDKETRGRCHFFVLS